MAAGIFYRELNLQISDRFETSSKKKPSQSVEKVAATFDEFKEALLKHIEDSQTIIHKGTLSKMVRRMEEFEVQDVEINGFFPCGIIKDLSLLHKFTETDKSVGSFRITETCYSDTSIKMTVREYF